MTGGAAPDDQAATGVIGVGSMGRHHARVYSELPASELVGVSDADEERAATVANEFGTQPRDRADLLGRADAVSVAVPTPVHAETVAACIDRGVDVLVEKPFVEDLDAGADLAASADDAGVTVQVGHIERYNPATRVAADVVRDLDVVGVDVRRLGPPLDRDNEDTVVKDLMVHDVDILLSLVDGDIQSIEATARDERHATAQFRFENGCVATLTASRLTHQKVRQLSITALSCRVNVDFISQTVEIHRRSFPEYVESNGEIRYRHESVVERPMVENGEPLKAEVRSFLEAASEGTDPIVTAEDALEVLDIANRIESEALAATTRVTPT
jgi:predicted dehydrogenase